MKVIALSYDRNMFDRTSAEFDRMRRCAEAVDTLDIIVFTRSNEPFVTMPVSSRFTVHATASRWRIISIIKAIRIGWHIAKQRQQIAVVTAQDPFETALVGWCIARPSRACFNVQVHSDVFGSTAWLRETPLNRLRLLLGKIFLNQADVIRVVSNRSKGAVETILGKGNKDIRVLPVSVALPHRPLLKTHTSNKTSFTFITAARLSVEKNIPLLLRAFAVVHKKHPHTKLTIFGSGAEELSLKTLAHELFGTLDSPVTFVGWTTNVYAELAKADAYVLSSNHEGWARVLIEALAAGLPIITTDVGCVGEVIIHNQHALVVSVGNEAGFAAAMERLVVDQDTYNQLRTTIANVDFKTLPGAHIETYAHEWRASLM